MAVSGIVSFTCGSSRRSSSGRVSGCQWSMNQHPGNWIVGTRSEGLVCVLWFIVSSFRFELVCGCGWVWVYVLADVQSRRCVTVCGEVGYETECLSYGSIMRKGNGVWSGADEVSVVRSGWGVKWSGRRIRAWVGSGKWMKCDGEWVGGWVVSR